MEYTFVVENINISLLQICKLIFPENKLLWTVRRIEKENDLDI